MRVVPFHNFNCFYTIILILIEHTYMIVYPNLYTITIKMGKMFTVKEIDNSQIWCNLVKNIHH